MQGGNVLGEPTFRAVPFEFFEFNVPFCLGETCHYFNQCDLFCSFHAIVEVQFRGLAQLDMAVNNHRDNLNSLYHHPDLILTANRVLRNILVSAYAHYIDTLAMNGACVGHRALIQSMLMFAMHLGWYQCWECHFTKEHKRKGLPLSMPSPAIDVTALLTNCEENLKLEQIQGTHTSILDLLGDWVSPLYAEPLSMAEHFDALLVGTRHLGELPKHGHCRDSEVTARVYEDEARQT